LFKFKRQAGGLQRGEGRSNGDPIKSGVAGMVKNRKGGGQRRRGSLGPTKTRTSITERNCRGTLKGWVIGWSQTGEREGESIARRGGGTLVRRDDGVLRNRLNG